MSPYYDYRLIQSRVQLVAAARSSTSQPTNSDAVAPSCTTPTTPGGHRRHHPHHHPDAAHTAALVNLLRSGLVRNLGNITSPKLYNRAFAGTKYLIEEYVYQVCNAVETIATLPTTAAPRHHHHQPTLQLALPSTPTPSLLQPTGAPQQQQAAASLGATATTQTLGVHAPHPHQHALHYHQHLHDPPHLPTQAKLDLIHDTRQSFGRSTLVLQGGALFGLVHLGVVKALFLRGLLPRIITGSATGALVAALVACHTEDELPAVLRGDGIDLSAFAGRRGGDNDGPETLATRLATLKRRVRRFWTKGYFLDVKVLEECVQANIGDITFMEAYLRSRRILNITVGPTKQGGPMLLNYLTAPYVVSSIVVNWKMSLDARSANGPDHSSSGRQLLPPTPRHRRSTATVRLRFSVRMSMAG